MNDLYRAPESELSEDLSYKPALGWKILFFVLLPLEIWSQYDTFLENTSGHPLWWLLLSMGIYLFYYIGLFGLAFAKKIFNRRFWQGYLPVMMLTDCFEIFSDLAAEGLHDPAMWIAIGILSPFILLIWYSIYRYQKVFERIQ